MKKGIICYNVALCPKNWTLDKVFSTSKRFGVLLYDSTDHPSAKPPHMLHPEDNMDTILLDISTEEGKKALKKFEK